MNVAKVKITRRPARRCLYECAPYKLREHGKHGAKRYLVSDPERGIAMSIELHPKDHCWMVGLAARLMNSQQLSDLQLLELGMN